MNCVELQTRLAETEDVRSAAQSEDWQAHLRNCSACAALTAELALIVASAAELRSLDEPSPRIWNSIEITLRQEGLIRRQHPKHSLLPALHGRGWIRWMVPAAAVLLLTVTLYLRHSGMEQGQIPPSNQQQDELQLAGLNDADLMQEVAEQPAAVKAQYSDNLRRVNESIQDAQDAAAANPNDEDAGRSLMEAYQQKAMLFELALDHSMNDRSMQ